MPNSNGPAATTKHAPGRPNVAVPSGGSGFDRMVEPILNPSDTFVHRHVGPDAAEMMAMLELLGVGSLDELVDQTVPAGIRLPRPLAIGEPRGEHELLAELKGIARKNQVLRSLIGMGFYDTITPPVIQRNILENPGWYTQYTPYQAEISQGRLEALLNFQTMVSDLTGLPLANASLLDESTAAAEAMSMARAIAAPDGGRAGFFVAADCHPQTIAVVRARGEAQGVDVIVADVSRFASRAAECFGVLVQYPATDGRVVDYTDVVKQAHAAGALAIFAADVLALTLLKSPGEFGADIAVGSTQRFGVPLGFGGPHAAYMSTRAGHARKMPGRLIGVSKDAAGNPALRLTLQTREQHIRREKATSNICTAQVLLAVMAGMYATYHGPHGLKKIAQRIHAYAAALAAGVRRLGHDVLTDVHFDTLKVRPNGLPVESVLGAARAQGLNLRDFGDGCVGVSLDEKSDRREVQALIESFAGGATFRLHVDELAGARASFPGNLARTSEYLAHPVFNRYHAEHELLRYVTRLQSRDLSLTTSMIPLGSCTMKLNATSEMLPVTWPEFGGIHPFAPADQTRGYQELFARLEGWLAEITGFAAVSLQPNAGSQGEYAGLLVIRAYHRGRGDANRDVCLIPASAHGTNPASAVVAGFRVVAVACDADGNVDLADLRRKAQQHAANLGALMVTYPSTHGVFEEGITEACAIVHQHGGQVYMDGANMNAQVGLTSPGHIGADVCHLNLHKTFCIPHGGGGPGMGPIGVAAHLAPFLPGHPVTGAALGSGDARVRSTQGNPPADGGAASSPPGTPPSALHASSSPIGAVSESPFGSASILTISYVYIALMGGAGLTRATQVAILNANYMAKRLENHYPVVYLGKSGRCAHEFILDCRAFEQSANVKVEDIAKRLMDYGFHAPTMSWPVPGTLMVEPTESEGKAELDRFCDAMIAIREEIRAVEEGRADKSDNALKYAPHTAAAVTADDWPHKYSRQHAAFPTSWTKQHKFWPAVARIDNPYGDRNLVCACPPVDEGDS